MFVFVSYILEKGDVESVSQGLYCKTVVQWKGCLWTLKPQMEKF